jgi:hypothetical protein
LTEEDIDNYIKESKLDIKDKIEKLELIKRHRKPKTYAEKVCNEINDTIVNSLDNYSKLTRASDIAFLMYAVYDLKLSAEDFLSQYTKEISKDKVLSNHIYEMYKEVVQNNKKGCE